MIWLSERGDAQTEMQSCNLCQNSRYSEWRGGAFGEVKVCRRGGNVIWFGGRKTCHSVLDYPFQSSDEMPVLLQDSI